MSTTGRSNNTSGVSDPTRKTRVKDEAGLFVSSGPVVDAPSPVLTQGLEDPGDENADADEEHSEEDDDEDEDGDAEYMEAINEKVMDMISNMDTHYDSAEERLPDLPAYHPLFKSIEQSRYSIIADAIHILQTAKYKDAETAQLLEQAISLQQIKYPGDRKVALIGDSGTGMFIDRFSLSDKTLNFTREKLSNQLTAWYTRPSFWSAHPWISVCSKTKLTRS